ncbi:MAG: hypothetical protein QOI61_2310 [Actinomycetota bacterium]
MKAFLARTVRVGRHEIPMAVVVPFAVGVVVRLLFAYTDNVVGPDESAYLGTGTSFWSGHGLTYRGSPELHFPPLLPVLLGGLAKVLPEPHHATVLVTFLASVALLPILAALAWRIGGRRAGVLALWIVALSPGLGVNLTRGTGGSEALYAAVMCGAALLVAGPRGTWSDPPSLARAAVVGGLIGVAYLIRPEGILISAVFGVVLGLRAIGGRLRRSELTVANVRRLAMTAATCLAALLVFVVPYMRYLHQHTGKWELTAKSVDVNIEAWRALAEQDRTERDKYLYRLDASGHSTEQKKYSLVTLAKQNPKEYLGIVGENLRQLYKSILSFNTTTLPGWRLFALPLLPFSLIGLWRYRSRATVIALAGVLGLALATVTGFFVLNRYLPPVIAALAVFAAVALADLDERKRRVWVSIGLVASVLSIGTYLEGPHGPQIVRERPEIQIAARWLRHNIPEGKVVMTRSTALPYYLPNNQLIVPPVGTVNQVWRYARFQNVKYFIFDPTTQLWRPDLAPLVDGGDHRLEGFETVHSFRVENRTTFIFKVIARDRSVPLGP